jgi:hypothetical protein
MIGRIYIIKNKLNNLMYVGSTIRNLETRMKQHRKDMYKFTNFKLYKAMNEFKPDNFYINLLEEFEYNNVKDLRKQEGKYVKIIKPELNKNIPGRSIEEYNVDNKEPLKLYRKLYYRKYREKHKEYLKQYRREYYKRRRGDM